MSGIKWAIRGWNYARRNWVSKRYVAAISLVVPAAEQISNMLI